MKYVIVEIQKSHDGTVALGTPIVADGINNADSTFYSILASASISAVDYHSVIMFTDEGGYVKSKEYVHYVAPVEPAKDDSASDGTESVEK